jgi:hypothetical protein
LLNQTKTPTFVQTNQFRHLLFPIETVKRHDGINEVVQTSIIRKQAKTQQVENMKKKNSQKNSNIDDLLKGKTPEEQIAILKEALQTEELRLDLYKEIINVAESKFKIKINPDTH